MTFSVFKPLLKSAEKAFSPIAFTELGIVTSFKSPLYARSRGGTVGQTDIGAVHRCLRPGQGDKSRAGKD